MKKKISSLLFISILSSLIIDAQEPDYVVQPTTKTYTKLKNRLIKTPVTVLVINGKAYLNGDIFLGTVDELDAFQNSVQVQSLIMDYGRWTNGIVPFVILDGFSEAQRQVIVDAMNHIASKTHVCFRNKTDENDYIKFKKVTESELGYKGGHSELGRVGGGQEIQITPTKVTNSCLRHEICHALGLNHEQNREDRDQQVEILWDNIKPPLQGNFIQLNLVSTDVGAYDFNSIMHYKYNTFGKIVNGVPLQTIKRKSNPSDQSFGTAGALSAGDIAGINSMYPTEQSCATLSILAPGELAVGDTKTVNISASNPYDHAGIYMRNGQTFEFTTSSPAWNNGNKETDCDGYAGSIWDAGRRHPDLNMMVLTGEIFEQDNNTSYTGHYFRIGCGKRTHTVTKTGFLVCFANDILLGGYVDNSRVVTLTVKRIE